MVTAGMKQDGLDPSTLDFLTCSLSAPVLKHLLNALKVSVPMGALTLACEQSRKTLLDAPPAQHLRFILNVLAIKGIQVAQLSWCRFDQRRLPVMLVHQGRWQVLARNAAGLLHLTDAHGQQQTHTEADFSEHIILWLRVRPKMQQTAADTPKTQLAARLVVQAMFKSRRWLSDVLLATVMVNLLAVSTAIFAMQVYDRVVPTLAYATLWTLVVGMGIVVSLDWLLKTMRAKILDSVSAAVDKSVSQQVFDHIMQLRLDVRPHSIGTLSAQVGGLDVVRQFFTSSIIFALVDMPFALLFIVFIGFIGGPIGWVYLLLFPLAATLGWITQKRLRRLVQQQMIRANERQGLLVDAVQGAESVRANNAAWRFSEQWQAMSASILRYNIQQKAISSSASVTTASLANMAYVSAIVVGVGQIEAGNLSMGALIACSILGGRVIAPVARSIQYLVQWQAVSQSLSMVNDVLGLETERRPEQNLLIPEQAPDRLELHSVRFFYPDSPIQQLHIPNLQFKAGDRVVLLGPVGSGKSTLLKILAGLYRPSEGRVRLGQADLWEIDPNTVASHVGYLPQQVHLFNGTLRSNLVLSGAVTDTHLLQVCAALGIDQIAADNPLGMDLAISEGGEGLSGGQRQLVGLGRVFLGQPKVWLLDEPTASLDIECEKNILQAIQATIKADDILLISTHRPALAAQLANRVMLMRRGEIVADGSPETVLPNILRQQNPAANPQGVGTRFTHVI